MSCDRCSAPHERRGLLPVGTYRVCLGCDRVMRADHAAAVHYVAQCSGITA